jgi:hypothetical protein
MLIGLWQLLGDSNLTIFMENNPEMTAELLNNSHP